MATHIFPGEEGLYDFCGSDDHMAPEIIRLEENPEDLPQGYKIPGLSYSFGVDIWALGIMVYELFTGEVPFFSSDDYVKLHIQICDNEPRFDN
jgi:serine/threonine protein kinase